MSGAPAQSTTIPLAEFKQERWSLLHRVNRIRANRCRPARQFTFRADFFKPESRAGVLAYWQRQVVRSRALSSRCLEARLWNWFYTSGAECVKSHEGAWTSNTGNGYYGGFQADMSFQATYGGEYLARYGTANNWLPIHQIHMAYRGWLSRGWAPWPNTSVMCGLR